MSSLVLSIPSAPAAPSNASAAPAAASSSAARGRDASSPADADSFGAALARSRDARSRHADDKAESAPDAPPARRRGPGSAAQREEASPAELLAMAMLTPAFSAQAAQQKAAAQAGETGARSLVEGAVPATADETLGAAQAPSAAADARSPAQAGTAATQAAQASAAEQDDKDARSAKAKAEALPAADTKLPAPALPPAAAAQVPDARAATASNAANASPAAATSAAKSTVDAAALPVQAARDTTPADRPSDAASDTPAQLPGAFTFKAALADAANGAAPAPAQPVPRFTVPTPVGADGWGADIGTQMIRMGADGHHVAELSLNPAGLGPLKVTLTLGDNQAQAMFVSAHESVRRALEAALPQLRDTLAGQGIQLGQASVDAGAQQQQAFNQERSFDAPVRPAQRSQPNAGAAVDSAPALAAATRSRAASGIDTFA